MAPRPAQPRTEGFRGGGLGRGTVRGPFGLTFPSRAFESEELRARAAGAAQGDGGAACGGGPAHSSGLVPRRGPWRLLAGALEADARR
eukprot:6071057-Pyramimonas_sp.AAC.1